MALSPTDEGDNERVSPVSDREQTMRESVSGREVSVTGDK